MFVIHESSVRGETLPPALAHNGGNESASGVVYIAYGQKAVAEAAASIKSLRNVWPDARIAVIGDSVEGANRLVRWPNRDGAGRWAKVNLLRLSPFGQTLYLDADTRIHGDVSVGFDLLDDGWDLIIVPSRLHGSDWLWHVGAEDRLATCREHNGQLLTLGGGVMWFVRNERTTRLFARWCEEWLRFQGQDQAALMRAYVSTPCKIWLLSRAFNSGKGPVVKHRFGKAKARL